ncbi:hypothetical protein HY484_04440, partial [Candidatus Woesearchaeota archaeon]|nr:hypothetical protein [Candidatus Woesearchaeota archaeon]
MRTINLTYKSDEPIVDLAKDTLDKNKQALIFVNTKRSAEKCAEDISRKLKKQDTEWTELADKLLHTLSKPTQQCSRLAACCKRGVVFHHAGLHPQQKDIIEEAFRKGVMKIICCTPTLAAGLDLPAFRAIIRDVKRYAEYKGMSYIPVLEYLQMAGRAGRPKFDSYGESIVIATTESEATAIMDKYVLGEPEEIYSKLAVEPVLRTYVLSLIASEIMQTVDEIKRFFHTTFWAHQYKDFDKLDVIIATVLQTLVTWQFLQKVNERYVATLIGGRVAQLYIDPFTAHTFIEALKRTNATTLKPITWIHLVTNSLEMRPTLRVKQKEYDEISGKILVETNALLYKEPSMFELEYEEYLNSFKTALMLNDWIEEKDEEHLLETYDVRPGELHVKLKTADWLIYALYELATLLHQQPILKEIVKTRIRLKYGAKEELLPLLRLEGIGRVRARKLFNNKIKNLGDVRKESVEQLALIVGKATAENVKKQAGANGCKSCSNGPQQNSENESIDFHLRLLTIVF